MAERIIRAQAVIQGKDETGPAFQSVVDKINRINRALETAGHANGIAAEVDKVSAALGKTEAALRAIDRYNGAQGGIEAKLRRVMEAQLRFRDVQMKIDDAGGKMTDRLGKSWRVAEAEVRRATEALEQQRREASEARGTLDGMGISVERLASEEARLTGAVNRSAEAFARQGNAARAAAAREAELGHQRRRFADGMGASGLGMGLAYGAGRAVSSGFKAAAGEQMAYMYTQLASGNEPTTEGDPRLRRTAEDASLGTVYSRADVAKMMPGIAGMADVPLDEALPFMRSAIQFAELAKQLGGSMGKEFDSQESAAAAVRMSHLLGVSDPREMGPILNLLMPATATSERSPAELVKILGYMTSSAKALGMSNRETINLGTLTSTLMPGTRAGTNVNDVLAALSPKGGPGAGQRTHRAAAARQKQLEQMGLIDPKTHQPFRDANGSILAPLIDHLNKYYDAHKGTALGTFNEVFGKQGARAALEMAQNPKIGQMLAELDRREAAFDKMGGVAEAQAKLNEATENQWRRAVANFSTSLDDLATQGLRPLTSVLKTANSIMESGRKYFDAHPAALTATAVGAGAIGLGGVAAAGYSAYKLFAAGPALTGAAAELTAAAAALKGSAGARGIGTATSPSMGLPAALTGKIPGIGMGRWFASGATSLGAAYEMWHSGVGTSGYDGKPLWSSVAGFPTLDKPDAAAPGEGWMHSLVAEFDALFHTPVKVDPAALKGAMDGSVKITATIKVDGQGKVTDQHMSTSGSATGGDLGTSMSDAILGGIW